MALTFENEINLTEASGNIEPLYVETPFMAAEHSGELFHYFIHNATAQDKNTPHSKGQYYEGLPWGGLMHHLTMRAVSKLGVKQFPQIGAIGFFKNLYTGKVSVLAPIHVEQKLFNPPTISCVYEGNLLRVIITPPTNVTYTVYRVIFRNSFFAEEKILYNTNTLVDPPLVRGDYEIYCYGYNEDTGVVSSESGSVFLNVPVGKDNWLPDPTSISLGALQDVNILSPQNLNVLQYNAESNEWQNAITPQKLSELHDVHVENPDDLDLLQFKETTRRWENRRIPVVKSITLAFMSWINKEQRIPIEEVIGDETKQFIQVMPAISSQSSYENAGIKCINQSDGVLTFSCKELPMSDLNVFVTLTEVTI